MYAIGVHFDALVDQLIEGIRRRFPNLDHDDSLGLIGGERRIPRGPGEPAATYTARMARWIEAHKGRGGPYEFLRQLYEYWQGTIEADLQYWNGWVFHLDSAGAITRQDLGTNFDGDTAHPYRWRLLIRWPTAIPQKTWGDGHTWGDGTVWGSGLPSDTVLAIRTITSGWNAAHARGSVTLQNGGRTWGIPAHNWGSGDWGSGTTAIFPAQDESP
jgi:hypothetical protein